MSAGITLRCDGTRAGQPCGGFLHSRSPYPDEVRHREAKPLGWGARLELVPGPGPARYRVLDACPACTRHPELS